MQRMSTQSNSSQDAINSTTPNPTPTPSTETSQFKLWTMIRGLGKNAKTQTFWQYLFVFVILVSATLLKQCYDFQTSPLTAHIKKGSVFDMWITVLAAAIFAALRKFIRYTCKDHVLVIINVKNANLNKEKRSEEYCKWIFDSIYYSINTVWAYFLLKDQKFFPQWLGGPTQGCQAIFHGYPQKPSDASIDVFYLIQLGNHLNSFVYQLFFQKADQKYLEYTLHHGCALFLIFFSYLMNYQAIGSIVLLLHDPCDVLLIVTRTYLDYQFQQTFIAVILASTFIFSWIYLRIIVFPLCCIRQGYEYSMKAFNSETGIGYVGGWPFFGLSTILLVLFIMHCFWISVILQSAFDLTRQKKDAHRTNYDE